MAAVMQEIMIKINNNKIAILALRKVPLIGAATIKKLWQKEVFNGDNYDAIVNQCLTILKKSVSEIDLRDYYEHAMEIIGRSDDLEIKSIDISDDNYPVQLKELKGPPSILYYKGDISKANLTIGIIGTREPDSKGIEIAKRIGSNFINDGFSICNGLATGIDEASINYDQFESANVVGVVAGGLNYTHSKTLLKSTAEFADKILEKGGLIVTEYPYDMREDKFKVVDSCAIQAGLSHGVILVQSKANGGSKFTLAALAELKRPLGVVSVLGAQDDIFFEANNLILNDFRSGMKVITNLKEEKIIMDKCYLISRKEDYAVFGDAVRKSIKGYNKKNKLF